MTTLYTIGFAGKSLEQFVNLLEGAGVQRLIDIRLRPSSQLSGYARQADLKYLLQRYEGIEYVHSAALAPTAELLDRYRASKNWDEYEVEFRKLMTIRDMLCTCSQLVAGHDRVAMLCSEDKPDKCHRRLVAEHYLKSNPGSTLIHL